MTGDWRHSSKCRDEDPELFFATAVSIHTRRVQDRAKAVCATCPVVANCLEWAMSQTSVQGIWGGTDEDQRKTLRRRAQRAAS